MTTWRDCPSHTGYQVSDDGQVRSTRRQVVDIDGHTRNYRSRPLAPCDDGRGYLAVGIRGATNRVHVLVAEAFIGPRPDGQQVRHLDGNTYNNNVSNLAYGTASANAQDMIGHGRHKEARKTCCPLGHELSGRNLVPKQYELLGKRACLACNRTHSLVNRNKRKGVVVDFKTAADAKYAEILAA